MPNYFEPFFSKFQCGFRKGFSTQQCLLSVLEKWKLAVDNRKRFEALLTDLSKTFECLSHGLLISKLNVYGFSINSLIDRLVKDYLTNRKQRTRIDSAYSSWEEILFVCDIDFIMGDISFASCADDNTPYTIGNDIEDAIFKLQNSLKILFQWFMDNQMKANPDKCLFICSTNDIVNLIVENQVIDNSKCEKRLGMKFDYKLTFNSHIDDICKKAGLK